MIEEQIEVINKLGLHARAAAKLVKLTAGFKSSIKLDKSGTTVDAKSIMGIMMLAASQGTVLTITADGEDCEQAVTEIREMFANCFDEGE